MDISSIIGMVIAFGILNFLAAGKYAMYINAHAFIVVIGGIISSTFVKFSLHEVLGAGSIIGKVFFLKQEHTRDLIAQIVDMANVARKDGILALERIKSDNPFLQKAINHCVDGVDPANLKEMLEKEIEYLAERHHVGIVMFESMGEAAPAFGMVGTLFGMVDMLANMSDPSSIGPAMATALLATCYGAIVANFFTGPMAIKLIHYSKEEQMMCRIVIDGITGIQHGTNPRILHDSLMAALSRKHREDAG
ncbi:MAG: MotA/TolQ/ExbB proton channel family protein [Magnetococcales bacterium]|nr:MotA/TolQ/ExbB proton channel family protein [Magnetococcales bacterium]